MATAASYFDRKPSSSIRPGLSHLQQDPSSPYTPQRTFSSAFSSPSVSYRAEEEALVFEFGARHLSAGFTGESYPRCKLGFGPDESRRAGDYRRWLPGYHERPRKRQRVAAWGEDHELWRMDLRGFDLGVVEDKIERAVRDAYTKYLLLDSKSRRLLVILPSVMPHQLLSTLLSTLFSNFQNPSITLLSPPVLSTAAAGCRSGFVVDIGWRETIMTGIYEYREVYQSRTTRAMRMVTLDMARLLQKHHKKDAIEPADTVGAKEEDFDDAMLSVDLDQAEEVTTRMAWCKSWQRTMDVAIETRDQHGHLKLAPIAEEEEPSAVVARHEIGEDPSISIPSPSSPRQSIQIPFSQFAEPAETALLAATRKKYDLDDHEQPLHVLIYKSILSLPPDVRAVCMSRIIITGGGSNIPGLKARLIDEVSALVQERGWDPVFGKAADKRRKGLKEISNSRRVRSSRPNEVQHSDKTTDSAPLVPASIAPQIIDTIDEKLLRDQAKESKPNISGVIRGVETLGAWAGGSLLASLRVKGLVEIEKDSFLLHGLAGARKDAEASVVPQKSFGPGMPRAVTGEKTGWTLAGWA
ncbi:hypothetical protein MMC28_007625 [Mycoblastus sanguinarius]|nr:hypothetical protein [Mycoblastus sanguinarius]